MRLAFAAALLVAGFTVNAPARAELEIGIGPVDEIDGEGAELATLSWLTEQEHPWEFMLGYITEREMTTSGPTPNTLWVSASKRFTWRGWFAQGGVAYTGEDNEILSNHFQFQTGLGWRGGPFTVSLRHLSNANTGGRNRGETFLLFQYGF